MDPERVIGQVDVLHPFRVRSFGALLPVVEMGNFADFVFPFRLTGYLPLTPSEWLGWRDS